MRNYPSSYVIVLLVAALVAPLSGCGSDALANGTQPFDRDGANQGAEPDSGGDSQNDPNADPDDDSSSDEALSVNDAGVDDENQPPVRKAKCVQKESQVIVIGDSYISWPSHTFPEDIQRESGQKWRMEAIGGMSMATGGLGSPLGEYIPNQFDRAIQADPDAHTVLMDGGGNDVLVGWLADASIEQCKDTGSSKLPQCQKVVTDAIAAAEKLMDRAIAAGIRDVVYFFYPHIPEGRAIGGPHPNEMLDFALPQVKTFCDTREGVTSGALRCHFIDMVPVFEGHSPAWFNGDIHPNSDGSKAMAKEVWQKMKDWCVGQTEDSGCCEP